MKNIKKIGIILITILSICFIYSTYSYAGTSLLDQFIEAKGIKNMTDTEIDNAITALLENVTGVTKSDIDKVVNNQKTTSACDKEYETAANTASKKNNLNYSQAYGYALGRKKLELQGLRNQENSSTTSTSSSKPTTSTNSSNSTTSTSSNNSATSTSSNSSTTSTSSNSSNSYLDQFIESNGIKNMTDAEIDNAITSLLANVTGVTKSDVDKVVNNQKTTAACEKAYSDAMSKAYTMSNLNYSQAYGYALGRKKLILQGVRNEESSSTNSNSTTSSTSTTNSNNTTSTTSSGSTLDQFIETYGLRNMSDEDIDRAIQDVVDTNDERQVTWLSKAIATAEKVTTTDECDTEYTYALNQVYKLCQANMDWETAKKYGILFGYKLGQKKILLQTASTSTSVIGSSTASSEHTTDGIIEDANSFLQAGAATTTIDGDNVKKASNSIYNILLSIGIFLAVAVGVYLGAKFMYSTAEDKAKVKEALIPYIAGCVVVFSAFVIWKLAITILGGIF